MKYLTQLSCAWLTLPLLNQCIHSFPQSNYKEVYPSANKELDYLQFFQDTLPCLEKECADNCVLFDLRSFLNSGIACKKCSNINCDDFRNWKLRLKEEAQRGLNSRKLAEHGVGGRHGVSESVGRELLPPPPASLEVEEMDEADDEIQDLAGSEEAENLQRPELIKSIEMARCLKTNCLKICPLSSTLLEIEDCLTCMMAHCGEFIRWIDVEPEPEDSSDYDEAELEEQSEAEDQDESNGSYDVYDQNDEEDEDQDDDEEEEDDEDDDDDEENEFVPNRSTPADVRKFSDMQDQADLRRQKLEKLRQLKSEHQHHVQGHTKMQHSASSQTTMGGQKSDHTKSARTDQEKLNRVGKSFAAAEMCAKTFCTVECTDIQTRNLEDCKLCVIDVCNKSCLYDNCQDQCGLFGMDLSECQTCAKQCPTRQEKHRLKQLKEKESAELKAARKLEKQQEKERKKYGGVTRDEKIENLRTASGMSSFNRAAKILSQERFLPAENPQPVLKISKPYVSDSAAIPQKPKLKSDLWVNFDAKRDSIDEPEEIAVSKNEAEAQQQPNLIPEKETGAAEKPKIDASKLVPECAPNCIQVCSYPTQMCAVCIHKACLGT